MHSDGVGRMARCVMDWCVCVCVEMRFWSFHRRCCSFLSVCLCVLVFLRLFCVCVCLFVCLFVCVWLCLFAFEFVCMCVFVLYGRVLDVFMCECLCVCVFVCMCVLVLCDVSICFCMCVCRVCVCLVDCVSVRLPFCRVRHRNCCGKWGLLFVISVARYGLVGDVLGVF